MLKSTIAPWTWYQKSSKDITSYIEITWQNARMSMEGNCQVNDLIYKSNGTRMWPKQKYDGLVEDGRNVFITINYHLSKRDIPTIRHFQVTCCTWKRSQVKHQNWSCLFWDTYAYVEISQRNVSCGYMKNWK